MAYLNRWWLLLLLPTNGGWIHHKPLGMVDPPSQSLTACSETTVLITSSWVLVSVSQISCEWSSDSSVCSAEDAECPVKHNSWSVDFVLDDISLKLRAWDEKMEWECLKCITFFTISVSQLLLVTVAVLDSIFHSLRPSLTQVLQLFLVFLCSFPSALPGTFVYPLNWLIVVAASFPFPITGL